MGEPCATRARTARRTFSWAIGMLVGTIKPTGGLRGRKRRTGPSTTRCNHGDLQPPPSRRCEIQRVEDTGSAHVRAVLPRLLVQRRSRARHAADDWALTGWEGGSTPAGGTGGVRPGGRRDRRRSGGKANHAARRSRRGLSRETGRPRRTVAGWSAGDIWRLPPGGRSHAVEAGELPNRERCRSGGFPGGSKGGGSTPRQSANVKHRVGWLTDLNSRKPALGGAAETASRANGLEQCPPGRRGQHPRASFDGLAVRLPVANHADPFAALPLLSGQREEDIRKRIQFEAHYFAIRAEGEGGRSRVA